MRFFAGKPTLQPGQKLMTSTLSFTAVTASGQAYEIDFPLHPQTRSAVGVSDLMTALLETISQTLAGRRDLSDGDVLQALAMTLAIRARMLSATPESTASLIEDLFGTAYAAARATPSYVAGRA
jgi:hypothetical protein